MRKTNTANTADTATDTVFEDPVAYLARFGICAVVIADTSLPAAA